MNDTCRESRLTRGLLLYPSSDQVINVFAAEMYVVLLDHLEAVQDDRRDDPLCISDKETFFFNISIADFREIAAFRRPRKTHWSQARRLTWPAGACGRCDQSYRASVEDCRTHDIQVAVCNAFANISVII